ncbi:MAG: amidohydrolase, partial [Flavobacteriia bacterium]|nr:amidohydrolase [Flavobacteriia bacterium]
MKFKNLFLGLCFVSVTAMSQDYFPKNDGVKVTNNNYTALTNARIYVSPTEVIDKATLLIKDGKVVSVGTKVNIPLQAVVSDLNGKTIYPSFIDLYSDFGVNKPKASGGGRGSQYDPSREGFYWNDHIMPENNAIDAFSFNNTEATTLLSLIHI